MKLAFPTDREHCCYEPLCTEKHFDVVPGLQFRPKTLHEAGNTEVKIRHRSKRILKIQIVLYY